MKKILYLFFLPGLTTPAMAQLDTVNPKELAEVVVTGQLRPQTAKNSVYQVRTITGERIRKQAGNDVQSILNKELNLRFSQDLATGGTNISLQGIKGQNVKILLDGLPITGRQGANNEIDLSQIDINSIEKIEIVEGPLSVVYGADALAGVINIITKKNLRSPFTVSARIQEETIGKEYGISQGIHNQFLSFSTRLRNWELGGGAGRNYFGGWKDTATGRELVWHKKDQLLANGYIGYAQTKFRIRYRIDGLDEIITNPGNFLFRQQSSGDTLANDQEYLSRRVMQQLQAGYTFSNRLNIQLQSAYTNYRRQVFSTTVSKATGDVRLDLASGRQSVVEFSGLTVRALGYYKLSKVFSFQPGVEAQIDNGNGERLKSGNNSVNDYAFFISSEITPSEKMVLRPGIRFVHNSVYDAPAAIPSLNSKFQISKFLDLRIAYAKGFRAPSLRELYFNFFDANHQIIGNPDLKAETSNSFNGSLNWSLTPAGKKITNETKSVGIVLNASYTRIKNNIDYAVSASDPNVFILTNISDSRHAATSLAFNYAYKQWSISTGAGITGFYNDYSAIDKSLPELKWSSEANAIINYTFAKCGLDLNLFYKLVGKRPFNMINSSTQQIIAAKQQAYSLADLTVNKKAFKYFSFSAGIKNLFDVTRVTSSSTTTGVHTSSGISNIATGRSYFLGIIFNYDKK